MDINKRISQIIEHLGYNKTTFAQKIGVSQPIITHITNGRNNPSLEVIQKILTNCHEINPEWLILGTGEMLLNNRINKDIITNLISDINTSIIKQKNEVLELENKLALLQQLLQTSL
jgi:predicted transcriptional regulator